MKGMNLIFGVTERFPLLGFPTGKARIRQRPGAYTQVSIRPPGGGVRRFYVHAVEGGWWPAIENGANTVARQR